MSWDDLIEYNRRWVELHKDNGYQAEAARRMTAMIDKMDELRTNEAVERVAAFLHKDDHGETLDQHDALCERDRGGCDRREVYTEYARTVIATLIGEN